MLFEHQTSTNMSEGEETSQTSNNGGRQIEKHKSFSKYTNHYPLT